MLRNHLIISLVFATSFIFSQNNGLDLDGINDYVTIDELGEDFSNINSFTVELWMKADFTMQTSSVRTAIFAINQPFGENRFEIILGGETNQDGLLMIYDQTPGAGPDYVGSEVIGDNLCHHIAYTFDGVNGRVYLDGVFKGIHVSTFDFLNNDRVSIGQEWDNSTPSQFYNGWVDDLRIWNYTRSDAEIANNMQTNFVGNEAGLIALYNFDQGISEGNNTGISEIINSSVGGPILNGDIVNMAMAGAISNFTESSCSISCPGFSIDVQSSPSCENASTGQLIVTPNSNPEYSYQWGAGADFETDSIVDALAPGNYQVTITDGDGCIEDTVLEVLTLMGSNAGGDSLVKICNDYSINLNDLLEAGVSGGIWTEVTFSNQFNTIDGIFTANSLLAGLYEFEYEVQTTALCPSDIALISVEVLDYPDPLFSVDDTVGCADYSVEFSYLGLIDDNYDCIWDFGDNTTAMDCGGTFHVYTEPGVYDVSLTITNDNTCTKEFTLVNAIEVLAVPEANFSMSPSIIGLEESTINFTNFSINASSFIWDFGDGSDSSVEVHPEHLYSGLEPGDYEVILIASNEFGCFDTFGLSITVADDLYLFVPNAFTPDGDGFNEGFNPILSSGYRAGTYKLEIYNRWGELIFTSNEVEKGWDGTCKGRNCMDGTYVWKVYYGEKLTDDKHQKTGHVTLLR